MTQNPGGREDEATLLEIGRLSARLIHDFKNQLGGMKLYAAYLKKRFADNAEGGEIADKISEMINEMASQAALVGKLSQPLTLNRAAHELGPVVELAVTQATPRAQSRQVSIALDLAPQLPLMQLDPLQLQTAVSALLTRAIDVTSEGGTVKISLQADAQRLRLQCVDNGAPLNAQQLESFFVPVAAERINSVGLNLAMARRIIEQHGGRVWARSGDVGATVVEVEFSIA